MDLESLRKWIIPSRRRAAKPIPPGMYHYMREADDNVTRFHLRVEPDGQGLLLANATSAARLSPAGIIMAKGVLEKEERDDILATVASRFKGTSQDEMVADLNQVTGIINQLATPEDNYPILNLDELQPSINASQLMAPLEASLPLATPRQLVPLIDSLWEIGIPHVTFYFAEGDEPGYCVRAIERAEDLGLISGIRGRATDLASGNLLAEAAQAGVDHITLPLAAADTAVHDALFGPGDHAQAMALIDEIQALDVYVMVEIALVEGTVLGLGDTLKLLQQKGIHTFSFLTIAAPSGMSEEAAAGAISAEALPQTADWIEETADSADVRFLWQPPVQRVPTLSLADQVRAGPRCAGDTAVRIEPTGEVIPARGPYHSAGNIFTMAWEEIWGNEAFARYRDRIAEPTRCVECPGLVICAADCPREPLGWATPSKEGDIS